MEQWIGHVTESPQGSKRTLSFEISYAAFNELANKTFDPLRTAPRDTRVRAVMVPALTRETAYSHRGPEPICRFAF
jgi:hypothetical protein